EVIVHVARPLGRAHADHLLLRTVDPAAAVLNHERMAHVAPYLLALDQRSVEIEDDPRPTHAIISRPERCDNTKMYKVAVVGLLACLLFSACAGTGSTPVISPLNIPAMELNPSPLEL